MQYSLDKKPHFSIDYRKIQIPREQQDYILVNDDTVGLKLLGFVLVVSLATSDKKLHIQLGFFMSAELGIIGE